MKTLSKEQRLIVKTQIEESAKANKISNLQQITHMQGKCAENKQEELLEVLCDIKRDYFNY